MVASVGPRGSAAEPAADPGVAGRLATIAAGCAAGVAVLGAIVLLGWLLDVPALKSIHPSLASMKANTALGFLLSGLALWLVRGADAGPRQQRASRVLSAAVLLLGAASLGQYVLGINLGIDQILFIDTGSSVDSPPGRMSQATASAFVLVGLSLLLLDARPRSSGPRPSQGLALAAGLISLVSLLGYLYGVRALYGIGAYGSMALHTTFGLLACCVALLFSRPDRGLMRVVASPGPGGLLARRMLPAAILLPAGIGWLRLRGQQAGYYQTEFGLALYAMGNILCVAGLAWFLASVLRRADIKRRKDEQAVRESEESLAVTLNSIGDALIATDAEARVVRMNPVAARMTGWTEDAASGRKVEDVFRIVNEETGAPAESPVDRVLREGAVVGLANHTELIAKDGRRHPIADSGAPIRTDGGDVRGVVLVFRDMTEERRAEAALRQSEERFRGLVENSTDAIMMLGPEGRIVYASPAATRIIGYGLPDWPTLDPTTLVHPEDAERVRLNSERRRTAPGVPLTIEMRVRHKDGSWRKLEVTTVNRLDDPRFRAVVSNIRDITDVTSAREALARTEEQLRQSQKLEAIGLLAGGVAHDFNNLLSVVISFATLAIETVGAESPISDDLRQILIAGENAADLTKQLLAFSRQQVLAPEVVDLNGIVARTNKMLRRIISEDIEVRTILGVDLGRVKVDPAQIEQVLMNLSVNARDAMPDGGTLTIETANANLDDAYARAHVGVTPGRHVMLAVSDTGAGMDQETQARVFEPFFTTKERGKGTGLGLSTVLGIVQQSGGNVWLYSEPGKGTTFKVYFPLTEEGVSPAAPLPVEPAIRGSETILFVEDNPQLRALGRIILQKVGYQVIESASGDEAILFAERFSGTIDLLVSDVVMPRMNGRQLAEKLIAVRPDIAVLYMSGYTDNTIVHHGVLDEGINFLQKPITPDALLRKVREVLDKRGRSRTPG